MSAAPHANRQSRRAIEGRVFRRAHGHPGVSARRYAGNLRRGLRQPAVAAASRVDLERHSCRGWTGDVLSRRRTIERGTAGEKGGYGYTHEFPLGQLPAGRYVLRVSARALSPMAARRSAKWSSASDDGWYRHVAKGTAAGSSIRDARSFATRRPGRRSGPAHAGRTRRLRPWISRPNGRRRLRRRAADARLTVEILDPRHEGASLVVPVSEVQPAARNGRRLRSLSRRFTL